MTSQTLFEFLNRFWCFVLVIDMYVIFYFFMGWGGGAGIV